MVFTDKEIKAWFEDMKNKYPNSKMLEHLSAVELAMFYDDTNLITKK